MKLDFSKQTSLPIDVAKALDQMGYEIREDFNNLIADLAKGHEKNIDWWVSELASRNTYTNNLLEDLAVLSYCKQQIDKGSVSDITVRNSEMAQTLQKYCSLKKLSIQINGHTSVRIKIKQWIKPWAWWTMSALRLPFLKISNAFNGKNTHSIPADKAITLIDVFVLENSIKDGNYEDRYYGKLWSYLTPEEKNLTFYLPSLFGSTRVQTKILKKIKTAKQPFLIKEDFLKVSDYFWALAYPIRALKLKPKQTLFREMDISPLLKSIWHEHLGSSSSIQALLNYRLPKRLSEKKIPIRIVVDWFENQAVDKGQNAGFKKWYPNTEVIGYQGSIPIDHYLCEFPTELELNSNVLPNKVATAGLASKNARQEFCPSIDITIAPAFRFEHIFNSKKANSSTTFTVLVSLPMSRTESQTILSALPKNFDSEIYLLKPHPATQYLPELLSQLGIQENKYIKIIQGAFSEALNHADLLITSQSNTAMETLCLGIPVIIIGSGVGLTQNPIPKSVDQTIWRLCYGNLETAQAIAYFREPKDFSQIAEEIREQYFEPINTTTSRDFLQLPRTDS